MSGLPFIWEVRQAEAEHILNEFLKTEFPEISKKNVDVVIAPIEKRRVVGRLCRNFAFKTWNLILIQAYDYEKYFPNLKELRETLRHELLHIVTGRDDDFVFEAEAKKRGIEIHKKIKSEEEI
jgi:hypothetical protein